MHNSDCTWRTEWFKKQFHLQSHTLTTKLLSHVYYFILSLNKFKQFQRFVKPIKVPRNHKRNEYNLICLVKIYLIILLKYCRIPLRVWFNLFEQTPLDLFLGLLIKLSNILFRKWNIFSTNSQTIKNCLWVDLHNDTLVTNFVQGKEYILKVAEKGTFFDIFSQNQRSRIIKAVQNAKIIQFYIYLDQLMENYEIVTDLDKSNSFSSWLPIT